MGRGRNTLRIEAIRRYSAEIYADDNIKTHTWNIITYIASQDDEHEEREGHDATSVRP